MIVIYLPMRIWGWASGMFLTFAVIGVASFSMVFLLVSGTVSAEGVFAPGQPDDGFHAAFLFGFAISFVVLVTAIFSRGKEEEADQGMDNHG